MLRFRELLTPHVPKLVRSSWLVSALLVLLPGLLALFIGVRVAQWFRLRQVRRR